MQLSNYQSSTPKSFSNRSINAGGKYENTKENAHQAQYNFRNLKTSKVYFVFVTVARMSPLRSVYTERDRERGLAALVYIKQTKVVFRVRFRALYKRL